MDASGRMDASSRMDVSGADAVRALGMDIGGTLVKAAWVNEEEDRCGERWGERWGVDATCFPGLSFCAPPTFGGPGERVYMCSFPSHQVPKWMETKEKMSIRAVTGGGAHKFEKELKDRYDQVSLHDEMTCLLKGLGTLVEHLSNECYHLENPKEPGDSSKTVSVPLSYPFLLVNIGTGVSILRVDSASAFERIGGSAIGGGTYSGLCALLLPGVHSFESAMQMSTSGDANKVNMLVRDIYGGDYKQCGLPGDVLASSFGKVLPDRSTKPASIVGGLVGYEAKDVAASLLHLVASNVAQIAYLTSRTQSDPPRQIVFAGNFLRQNRQSIGYISHAVDFWSQSKQHALFLRHEGFCGAIGALALSHKLSQLTPKVNPSHTD
jgi:pantothenate kinase